MSYLSAHRRSPLHLAPPNQLSCSLNSSKGIIFGTTIGIFFRGMLGVYTVAQLGFRVVEELGSRDWGVGLWVSVLGITGLLFKSSKY